jgi:putative transposase
LRRPPVRQNGFKPKSICTRICKVHLRISQTRDYVDEGRRFHPMSIDRGVRSKQAMILAVSDGDDVVRFLEQVTAQHGKPKSIRVDTGSDFISRSLDLWAYFKGVKLDFSSPGKLTDNAKIESFHSRLRAECSNQRRFLSLDETRAVIEAWREDYSRVRPHDAPGNRTPSEFARPLSGHTQITAAHG